MKKKAEDLQPGDVITNFYGATSITCPAVVVSRYNCGRIVVVNEAETVSCAFIGYAQEVEVESPALTPAQQHADEMLELLRDVKARCLDPMQIIPQRVTDLLARIDPPKAPTVEELADMLLVAWKSGNAPSGTRELLERARAAGQLK